MLRQLLCKSSLEKCFVLVAYRGLVSSWEPSECCSSFNKGKEKVRSEKAAQLREHVLTSQWGGGVGGVGKERLKISFCFALTFSGVSCKSRKLEVGYFYDPVSAVVGCYLAS